MACSPSTTRNIINAAYVVNLPSAVHGNRLVRGAVNGWELSGITQWQSGAPIQPNPNGALNVQYPGMFASGERSLLQPCLLRARYHDRIAGYADLAVHQRTGILQQRSLAL